jgi:hypothetical protein
MRCLPFGLRVRRTLPPIRGDSTWTHSGEGPGRRLPREVRASGWTGVPRYDPSNGRPAQRYSPLVRQLGRDQRGEGASADRLVPKSHGRPIARRAESAFPYDPRPGPTRRAFSLHTPSLHHRLIHDESLNITSGPDGGVCLGYESEFLRYSFAGQRKQPWDAKPRPHDTGRYEYKDPLRTASRGGRETVQIAGLEHCLRRFSNVKDNVLQPQEAL